FGVPGKDAQLFVLGQGETETVPVGGIVFGDLRQLAGGPDIFYGPADLFVQQHDLLGEFGATGLVGVQLLEKMIQDSDQFLPVFGDSVPLVGSATAHQQKCWQEQGKKTAW